MIYFPHPLSCNDEGLLAIGGDLNIERLKLAYRFGIFPWYNQKPILWWFTSPRCVLFPDRIQISKSMKSLMYNKRPWGITMDRNFHLVMDQCAKIARPEQHGTWITNEMREAYHQLHQSGDAHSIEIWSGEKIIGGLYGVVAGKIFYGESMFSSIPNTSKYALIHLAQYLLHSGCMLIDCQQDTPHMRTMGAVLLSKNEFWHSIKINTIKDSMELNSQSFQLWLNSTY